MKPRRQAHEEEQLLSINEEDALVEWCEELTRAGYPLPHAILREMAHEIQMGRVEAINTRTEELVSYPPVGIHWAQRFLERHPNLKSVYCQQIELKRWIEPTKAVLGKWFRAFREAIRGIPLKNIFNMDETGFLIGTLARARVIIDTKSNTPLYRTNPGRQEWVSVVECICADGSAVSPLFIFKGKGVSAAVSDKDLPDGWSYSSSGEGWTTNIHGLKWLRECFEPETREKAAGKPRVLICDRHDSHITGDFIDFCLKNNIWLLVLPLHTSHLLQPLDLAIFVP
jgi:hypothetical protein